MRVLVTGVKGQLGHDVMDELAEKGIEGIGVDVENGHYRCCSLLKSNYRGKTGCSDSTVQHILQ